MSFIKGIIDALNEIREDAAEDDSPFEQEKPTYSEYGRTEKSYRLTPRTYDAVQFQHRKDNNGNVQHFIKFLLDHEVPFRVCKHGDFFLVLDGDPVQVQDGVWIVSTRFDGGWGTTLWNAEEFSEDFGLDGQPYDDFLSLKDGEEADRLADEVKEETSSVTHEYPVHRPGYHGLTDKDDE
jgi:hypothetical protein